MGIDPGKSVYFCYTTMGARNHMTEYQQIIHCRWCDEPVDDSGSDFEQDEDAYLYHKDCWIEMQYEQRLNQYMKHAPDNMG